MKSPFSKDFLKDRQEALGDDFYYLPVDSMSKRIGLVDSLMDNPNIPSFHLDWHKKVFTTLSQEESVRAVWRPLRRKCSDSQPIEMLFEVIMNLECDFQRNILYPKSADDRKRRYASIHKKVSALTKDLEQDLFFVHYEIDQFYAINGSTPRPDIPYENFKIDRSTLEIIPGLKRLLIGLEVAKMGVGNRNTITKTRDKLGNLLPEARRNYFRDRLSLFIGEHFFSSAPSVVCSVVNVLLDLPIKYSKNDQATFKAVYKVEALSTRSNKTPLTSLSSKQ